MKLIFGKNSPKRILLILLPGALIALLIAYFYELRDLTDLLSLVLAVDIAQE